MSKKSEQKNAEAKKTVSEEELIPEEVENVPSPEERALAEAAALAEDYKRKWYSVTAEYENYRKRTALTRTQSYAEGRADVVSKLFPVGDNLERDRKSTRLNSSHMA